MSNESLEVRVRTAVGVVMDPELRRPLGELGMLGEIRAREPGQVEIDVMLTVVGCPAADTIERDVREAALAVVGVESVHVAISVMTDSQRHALREQLRPQGSQKNPFAPPTLTRVIAVSSGKGGVGKSTITVNLATELARRGFAVGLIDADVYGYSVPALLGLRGADGPIRPVRINDMIIPPVAHGVKVLSIGMFVDDTDIAVAWRGPMLQRTISQFLSDAWFGALDFLLLDLPPGTGDMAITVGQLLPNAEILIVTTPQASASDVAVRSGSLAHQLKLSVIGVVENMTSLTLPDGTVVDLFGSGGADVTAHKLGSEVLARIPLSVAVRTDADAGDPVVIAHPDDSASLALRGLADSVIRRKTGSTHLNISPE